MSTSPSPWLGKPQHAGQGLGMEETAWENSDPDVHRNTEPCTFIQSASVCVYTPPMIALAHSPLSPTTILKRMFSF